MLIDRLKNLSKDTVLYSFGSVVEFISAFFLLPIFTRVFTPEDYGVLDTIATFSSILLLILLFGLNSATQRFYFDARSDEERKGILSTSFWFLASVGILISGFSIFFAPALTRLLFGNEEHTAPLRLMLAAIPAYLTIMYIKDVLRLQFSPWKYNIMGLLDFVLRIALIIFFVVVLRLGLSGNFLGLLAASFVTFLLGSWYMRSWIRFRFSFSTLKPLLRYGVPLVFASLAYWVISLSDRIFIVKLVNLEQLGLYSIANKISSVLLLPITAFGLAWSPLVFKYHQHDTEGRFITKTFTYALLAFFGTAIIIAYLAREVLVLLAPSSYLSAVSVIGILSAGLVFLGVSGILSTGLALAKKTSLITISTFIAAATNIVFNILFIPSFGIYGAAVATAISYAVLAIFFYYFGQKYYSLHYEIRKIITITLIGLAYLLSAQTIHIDSLFVSIATKIGIIISFPLVLLGLRVFDHDELQFARAWFRSVFKKPSANGTDSTQ